MSDSLSMRITKMLFEAEPGLLNCDASASARVSCALADTLGSVLSIALSKHGEANYIEMVKYLVGRINKTAMKMSERVAEKSNEAGAGLPDS